MKLFIIVLLTFVLGALSELRSIYYYQGQVTFDKKMLAECLNTTQITRPPMTYISCKAKWSPYVDTLDIVLPSAVSKFNTGCYGLIGEIYYGHIQFGGYWAGPAVTRGDISDCFISHILGNHYGYSFIGALPGP